VAVDAFALVLLMIALGKFCAHQRLLPLGAAETLNLVAINICLPAAVLLHASKLVFAVELLGLIAVPWLLLLASIALVAAVSRLLRLSVAERAVLLLCVPLTNSSFLGYPLIEAFLGHEALPYAVVYDQFGTFLILSTWGLWVLARYGGDSPPTAAAVLRKVIRFPPFIALLLALTVMPAAPPSAVSLVLERLSDALLPIVTLAIGLQLRFRVPRNERAPLAAGLLLKLVLLPAIAWPLCLLFGMPDLMTQATVLETAMAPMITASALAISHRLAPGLAAAMVGFGIPLSLLTLLGWRWVLGVG
jgi:predicted permease